MVSKKGVYMCRRRIGGFTMINKKRILNNGLTTLISPFAMGRNVLITGGSGYLGGSLLDYLAKHGDQVPADAKLYALVRKPEHVEAVRAYGAEGIRFDVYDPAAVSAAVVGHDISVVFWLADAFHSKAQVAFIDALAEVKKRTGQEVHFLHVR